MTSVLGVISISAVTTAGAIIINQISSLSTNVFALITNIVSIAKISTTIYQTELIKLLTKTDVEATLKLLHAIILEIPHHINLEDEKMKNQSNSIIIALENIKNIISMIEKELEDIHAKIDYNNKLYLLTNIRSIECLSNLQNIETLISVLDIRSNYLFRTLKIFKLFN